MKAIRVQICLLACGLLIASLKAQGATLPLGQVTAGTIASAGSSFSYTFTGSVGEIVDLTITTTSGTLAPKLQLYNPSEALIATASSGFCNPGPVEMNTEMLTTAGTYTLIVSDCNNTNTGNYNLYFQSTSSPVGAANLPYDQTLAGTVAAAAQSNTYTFSANANDLFNLTVTATSGSLAPKIRLYNPGGELNTTANNGFCNPGPVEMNTITLPATGTYTILLGDCNDTYTGNYEIYTQLTDTPTGPIPLLFGQTRPDAITTAAESNTYTFSGTANDVLDITATTTSGSLAPKIRLYNPGGALNTTANSGFCNPGPVEMDTVTLPVTGTYTVLVSDCSDTYTGSYNLYSQKTSNPFRGSALAAGQTVPGLIAVAAENRTYRFSANANDLLDLTVTTTSGSLAPKMRLYNPDGQLNTTANSGFCNPGPVEMDSVTLPTAGIYTLLLGDCNDTYTGNYEIYSQKMNAPAGGTEFVFGGGAQAGTISNAAQNNTYIFGGTSGAVLQFTMTPTSGSLVPKLRLYNPDGSLAASASNGFCNPGSLQTGSITLTQTGQYTLLVTDCSDTYTGNYNISAQCLGSCTSVPVTPIVTVAPSSAYITTVEPLLVTVTVGGSPTPTGSVSLSGGGYAPAPVTLSGGTASFSIPAGSLTVGNDTLVATYTPDASSSSSYNGNTGSAPVTVVTSAFPCTTSNPNPNPNPATLVAKGDFNGDCRSDLLWTNTSTGQAYTWFMNGTALASATSPGTVAAPWVIQGYGDFNGDGKTDILWRNTSTGQVYIWLMNGTTLVSSASPGTVAAAWVIMGVGDFNGDGKSDILWQNSSTGQIYIWLMNGTALASSGTPGTVGSPWVIKGVGDFNGDGKADILWQSSSTGQVYIWLMNGTVLTSSASPGTAAAPWTIAGVGDFDGDGESDILWRNSSTGQVYIWLMNGTVLASAVSPGTVGTVWSIKGIGDYNGDGTADVLWQNSSGVVYVWLMTDGILASSASPGAAAAPWQILGP